MFHLIPILDPKNYWTYAMATIISLQIGKNKGLWVKSFIICIFFFFKLSQNFVILLFYKQKKCANLVAVSHCNETILREIPKLRKYSKTKVQAMKFSLIYIMYNIFCSHQFFLLKISIATYILPKSSMENGILSKGSLFVIVHPPQSQPRY